MIKNVFSMLMVAVFLPVLIAAIFLILVVV